MPHHLCCHTSRSFCKANKKSDIPVEIFILSELVSSLNRICLPFCLINWLDSSWFLPTISFLVTGSRNLQNVGIFLVFSPNNTKILHFFFNEISSRMNMTKNNQYHLHNKASMKTKTGCRVGLPLW